MGKDEVLSLDTRRRIYQRIEEEPGLHLRELARNLEMPLSTVRHHLRYMDDRDIITVRRDGQYKRYFPTRVLSPGDKEIISVLRREKPREMLLQLLAEGREAWYGELKDALDYPSSTLGLYLKELVERGIVERQPVGRSSIYRVTEPERVKRLLIEYKESFYDRWVDRVLELVEEIPATGTEGEPET